ncbi:BrnA antitoxin family protein [Candidatus Daviesbacteria bacterium]|nr:BrnA antitoxin family protein [Candidatus Daviesbacteria bacterium]
MKKLKQIPKFKSEDQEAEFWATHDSTDYFDISKAVINPSFPNLKPSTKTITIRVTQSLLDALKMIANKKDVPYQSLVKIFLDEKVKEEFRSQVKHAP